jgi:uncharacterized iron-regulated protein
MITFTCKAQKKKTEYLIYSVKAEKLVEPVDIIEDFENYDVLFYGEEHDDLTAHKLQTMLFEIIFEKYGEWTVLSMEMFEKDIQFVLDEYLDGLIKEKYLRKAGRAWGNYKDYRPMVEFAKKNKLPVIAANAPHRYVNLVNREGIEVLMQISDRAKEALAPLPYTIAKGGKYEKKFRDLGKSEKEKKDTLQQDTLPLDSTKYNAFPGHSLWDATMAYSIFQHKKRFPNSKIFHLNGKFHTEEHFGIVPRLKEYDENIRVLVITSTSEEKKFNKIDFAKYSHLGDYIIFTDPRNKK